LLSTREIELLHAIFEQVEHRHPSGFSATLLDRDLAQRQRTHAAIVQVVSPSVQRAFRDYRIVFAGFVVKRPSDGPDEMPLHQDISLVNAQSRPGISLWAPLVDVDEANGCLQVVAGSARLNPHPRAPGTRFCGTPVEPEIRRHYLQSIPMRAGQVIAMDQATSHSSASNGSGRIRPVAACVLIPCESTLMYYHRTPVETGVMLEGFEVGDGFLLEHQMGTRPVTGQPVTVVPEVIPLLTAQTLRELLPGANMPSA
jgi:ectoine hydroxylase-related dioxygenase (phytanoyl-CoA dioxygenase family)